MKQRLDYMRAGSEGVAVMQAMEKYLKGSGLEHGLLELVKMRASQINGCAFCIDMHSKDARAAGETEQRLYGLSAWQEAPFYSARERAALAWTEALTLVTEGHVPDAVYEQARAEFEEKELAALTFAVTQINAWNRIAIAFRVPAGTYQPPRTARSSKTAETAAE